MSKVNKVYYVCFYAQEDTANKIVSYPSVWSKIDYVADSIKQTDCEVEIVSVARSVKGVFKGFTKQIDRLESIKYFTSRCYKSKLMNQVSTLLHWAKILFYLLNKVKKNETVLVYHSVYNLKWLKIYHRLFRKKYNLEIEDVFSALNDRAKKFSDQEWECFSEAETVLCVNDLIAEKLKNDSKIISYGSYYLPRYKKDKHDCIRLVYAGVIEQERNAAFLAARAMQFLSTNYELNILGFGNSKDIQDLNILISDLRAKGVHISYLGRMSGSEYYSFLQNCDIGLSTHMYDESNMSSADNTFPSKVLVYMSNGLAVVAQRLECLTKSQVDGAICYYDSPEPRLVAEAIKNVNLECAPRMIIQELDCQFKENIRAWLGKQNIVSETIIGSDVNN